MSIFLTVICLFILVNCNYGQTTPSAGDKKQVITFLDPIENRYINITVKKDETKSNKTGSAIIFGDMADNNTLSDEDRQALADFGNLKDDSVAKKPSLGVVKRVYANTESAGIGSGIVADPLMGLAA